MSKPHKKDAAVAEKTAEPVKTEEKTLPGADLGPEPAAGQVATVPAGGALVKAPDVSLDELLGGGDDFAAEDIKIPFIRLIQKLSPQVDKDAAEFIPGCEVGMILNTGTGELYDAVKGVPIIVCAYQRELTEWLPKRGGMARHHGTDLSALKTARTVENSDGKKEIIHSETGNVLIEAGTYYILVPDLATGVCMPAVIAMSSSQFTPAKELNALIRNTTRKRADGSIQSNLSPFAATFILRSVKVEKNNNTWYNYKPERLGLVEELFPNDFRRILTEANAFRQTVLQGEVKVDHEKNSNAESEVKMPF